MAHPTRFELVTSPSAGSITSAAWVSATKTVSSPIIRQYSGFTPKAPAASQNSATVRLSIRMRYLIVLACFLTLPAETPADVVTFPGAEAEGYSFVSEVKGELILPEAKGEGNLPVVLILHGSAGIDGRGEFHGKALNAAGIGTLEIFMFSRGNRPRAGRNENLTHMYGALKYLASRSEIDPGRIGVMGFSWGGGLSLTAASASITQLFTGGQVRFAAHAPFYPVCWSHLRMTSDHPAGIFKR